MTTPQVTTRTKRNAFTLTELMIVIVIIGILVAISSPFIHAALKRAKEFTIQNEIVQMDAAVKRFETKHGFFPPAIGPGLEIDTTSGTGQADFLRYLNRIAPNHAERGAGLTKWWTQVGVNLDLDSSLVFWLSGLCTSKQYPLSGNATIARDTSMPALAPYNANKDVNDVDLAVTIDRDAFFDFNSEQIEVADPANPAGIKSYHQPEGTGDSLAYLYLDSKSYASGNAYHFQDLTDPTNPLEFFNSDSFQIMGPGLDGQVTRQTQATAETNTFVLSRPPVTAGDADPEQDDNITNFANGRLDTVFE